MYTYTPLVSVIVPNYNKEIHLTSCINSVLNQSYKHLEIIFIDNFSTDSSIDIIKGINDKRINIIQYNNKGVIASSRNVGIKNSKGELLAFLDSDDYWHAEKLEKQIKQSRFFLTHHIFFTDEIWFRNGIRVNPKNKHRKKEGWIFQASLALCLMAPSTVMLSRKLLEKHGKFDEDLPVCEDYDLWLRLTAYYPVVLLNEKLMTRQGGHSDQLSRKLWGIDRYRVKSLQKILSQENLRYEDRIAAIQMLQKKCDILIKGFQNRGNMKGVRVYQNIAQKFSDI